MPKNEFPHTIRQGVIVVLYPGATSNGVENQLTQTIGEIPLELRGDKNARPIHPVERWDLCVRT